MLDFLKDLAPYVATFGAGLVCALKVIAPRTRTKYDDKVLAFVEAALPFVPKHVAEKAPVAPRAKVIDHRPSK